MKKLYLYIVLILSAVTFYSCEQPVEEEQIPYIPKLVIRALIKEGKGINNIYIGRTVPVSVQYSSAFANLSDAAAIILYHDQIYPLRHYGNGLYKNDTLQVVRGEKYYLIASWQNLTATAETIIPKIGNVSGLKIRTDNSTLQKAVYLEASVAPYDDEVYGCTWALFYSSGTIFAEADSFANIYSTPVNGLLDIKSKNIPSYYSADIQNSAIRLYAYDSQFADYYNTQGSNKVSDAIFGQTGSKIKWNIKGEGIGLFIGVKDSLIKIGQ